MPAVPQVHWINNDNTLEVLGLKNELTAAYLNAASVTVTLTAEATGAEIAGQVWPLPLSYVPGSDGDYRATLVYDLVLTEGQVLFANIVADGGFGLHAEWKLPIVVQARND